MHLHVIFGALPLYWGSDNKDVIKCKLRKAERKEKRKEEENAAE